MVVIEGWFLVNIFFIPMNLLFLHPFLVQCFQMWLDALMVHIPIMGPSMNERDYVIRKSIHSMSNIWISSLIHQWKSHKPQYCFALTSYYVMKPTSSVVLRSNGWGLCLLLESSVRPSSRISLAFQQVSCLPNICSFYILIITGPHRGYLLPDITTRHPEAELRTSLMKMPQRKTLLMWLTTQRAEWSQTSV